MNQQSQASQQSIKQAEVIEETSPYRSISSTLTSEDSDISSNNINSKKAQEEPQVITINHSLTIPTVPITQIMDKDSVQNKTRTSKQKEILKKINIQKILKTSLSHEESQKERKGILGSQPRLKKMPQELPSQQKKTQRQIMQNCKKNAIRRFKKEKYIKKNYEFEDTLTKIKDLKINEKSINLKGEILFIWEKQIINEKWAKTDMVCLEIYDGTGSVIVVIPQKILSKKLWEFQIGKWVQFGRVQPRQKYPKKICLLVVQTSQVKVLAKSQIPQHQLFQPQKLGITLKQLELEPIGRVSNLVCLVISKMENQFIKSIKGNSLMISKLVVYDPIDKKMASIKLWQEKADLTFHKNAVVYLLRGVQIKQFKGIRQYHACKDFNYRVLTHSSIQQHLKSLYEERWQLLSTPPKEFHQISIQECKHILERKYNRAIKQLQKIKIKDMKEPSENQNNSEKKSQSPLALSENEYMNQRVYMSWSECTIKFINFQIEDSYQRRYTYCSQCFHKAMINCQSISKCPSCNSTQCSNIYWIKCQFEDGKQNYLGEISEKVAAKLFSIDDQLIKMDFFEQLHINFKRSIVNETKNVAVRALIATTKEKIDDKIWVYGHYILDILPFEDLLSQEKDEETRKNNVSSMKNNKKQLEEQSEMTDKIVKFLK